MPLDHHKDVTVTRGDSFIHASDEHGAFYVREVSGPMQLAQQTPEQLQRSIAGLKRNSQATWEADHRDFANERVVDYFVRKCKRLLEVYHAALAAKQASGSVRARVIAEPDEARRDERVQSDAGREKL